MSRRTFYGILMCALLVAIIGLRVDVMEVDAAQYAEMSWEMLCTKSFLQVHALGHNYLDKPPLLFWLSALSYYLFGISNAAYKLPSLFFACLAVFSTYRLAQLYYSENTARLSAVVLATTQAIFLMTNDVRTDTLLMGSVALAIWQWAEFSETRRWENILGGSLGMALAMLAKGPIGLIAVGAALAPHLWMKRKWKVLLDARLFVALILIAALLLPMCLGLYRQFGWDGLRFYFWTQSFGRITGESEWNNHPDTFFLVHTTAWTILPWTLFFFFGWFKELYALLKTRFSGASRSEWITLCGFTLVLIALSLSKYQLPHYIYVVFPLAAIIAAKSLEKMMQNPNRVVLVIQSLAAGLFLVVAFLLWYAFSLGNYWGLVFLIIAALVTALIIFRYRNLLTVSVVGILLFNAYLSTFFFPALLQYQPEGDFGRYVTEHTTEESNFFSYRFITDYSLAFYARQFPPTFWNMDELKRQLSVDKTHFIITTEQGFNEMKAAHIPFQLIEERLLFKVARMNFQFLNPKTRKGICENVYLIETKP